MRIVNRIPSPATTARVFLVATALFVIVSVLFAGCSSQPAAPSATPAAPATATGSGTSDFSLPYGVNLSLPGSWQRDDAPKSGVRDYGRDTVNIANFHSPTTPSGEKALWNTLSIDLDRDPGTDFEGYFNNATLAVEKAYHTEAMVSLHSFTMDIAGHKSYELTFETFGVKGYYIFTRTDNGMYIFAFRGSDKLPGANVLRDDVLDITKTIRISP